MDRADARMDRFEKQLKATANLVRAGLKIVLHLNTSHQELAKAQKELAAEMKGLAAAQKQTDANVNRLVKLWLPRGGDGRVGPNRR